MNILRGLGLVLASYLFVPGCGPADSVEPVDNPLANYNNNFTRTTILDDSFDSPGPWALNNAAISGGALNLNASGAAAQQTFTLPATGNFEVEAEVTISNNSFVISYASNPAGNSDQFSFNLSQGAVVLQRVRSGVTTSYTFGLSALIAGTAKVTIRNLNGEVYLFINEGFAGQTTASRFGAASLDLRHGGGNSSISVRSIRVTLLD